MLARYCQAARGGIHPTGQGSGLVRREPCFVETYLSLLGASIGDTSRNGNLRTLSRTPIPLTLLKSAKSRPMRSGAVYAADAISAKPSHQPSPYVAASLGLCAVCSAPWLRYLLCNRRKHHSAPIRQDNRKLSLLEQVADSIGTQLSQAEAQSLRGRTERVCLETWLQYKTRRNEVISFPAKPEKC